MKKTSLTILFILVISGAVCGQVTKVGTTVANFLLIDTGARAVGMGGAYVAVADGPISIYWNPSGIAHSEKINAIFNHSKWLADINYNFFGLSIPLSSYGTLGLSAFFVTMNDMEITTVQYPEGIENAFFSAGNYAFGLSYALNLTDRFSIGFTGKLIEEHIAQSKARAIAFDVGTLYITEFNNLKIGMSISNYGSKMQMSGNDLLVQHDRYEDVEGNNPYINAYLKTDEFDLPLIFRFGLSWDALQSVDKNQLVLAVDGLVPNNNYRSISAGTEYIWNDMVSLRFGYNTWYFGAEDEDQSGLSFGAGFKYGLSSTTVHLDYAYRDFGVLKDIQMFSFRFSF